MGILIRNTLAVLPDGDGHEAGRHDIYLQGNVIAGIDKAPEGFVATETIDGTRRLTIPGLVNAHTHTYMSLMRNAADDLTFMDWLFGTVMSIEDRMEPEDAYWGSLLGQIEMIRSGTTCFNDMQMHVGQTTRAVADSGMRAVIGRGLQGDAYDENDRRITEALKDLRDYSDCDRLSFFLAPHAPYTCAPEYLRLVVDVARREGLGIHMHIAESETETTDMWRDHHCTPVEYVRDAGVFELPTIAAHCVRVNASDRAILAENGVSVVTNPASNMKLGNVFAPVPELIEHRGRRQRVPWHRRRRVQQRAKHVSRAWPAHARPQGHARHAAVHLGRRRLSHGHAQRRQGAWAADRFHRGGQEG